jgi:hypothetical protein
MFLLATVPAWAARKTTVQELKEILIAFDQGKKSDDEIATRLKQIDLGEELTQSAMNDMMRFAPGPLSTEQMYVLEGRSAALPPPVSDLPATAAPDVTAQKAILAKAVDYITNIYTKNPRLIASRSTSRFQDGVEGIRTNSGMTSNMPNIAHSWATPDIYMRFLGTHSEPVESERGIELVRAAPQKQPWGQNGQISDGGPGPVLSVILQQAAADGKLNWLRWETVNGKLAAVFSFAVPKKKSQYEVHYCCFPVTQDTGRMGWEGTEPNLQFGTTWKDFRTVAGYHGEFFVDPQNGVIVRVITQAELKPTDFVHEEQMRVDYGPVQIDGKTCFVPVSSVTFNEVVPNGDNYAARYSVRHTLFLVTYDGYQRAGSSPAIQ